MGKGETLQKPRKSAPTNKWIFDLLAWICETEMQAEASQDFSIFNPDEKIAAS